MLAPFLPGQRPDAPLGRLRARASLLPPSPGSCEVEDINAQNGRAHAAIIRSELVRHMRQGARGVRRDAAREAKDAAREARRRAGLRRCRCCCGGGGNLTLCWARV